MEWQGNDTLHLTSFAGFAEGCIALLGLTGVTLHRDIHDPIITRVLYNSAFQTAGAAALNSREYKAYLCRIIHFSGKTISGKLHLLSCIGTHYIHIYIIDKS
jgi:hypothetical protein